MNCKGPCLPHCYKFNLCLFFFGILIGYFGSILFKNKNSNIYINKNENRS